MTAQEVIAAVRAEIERLYAEHSSRYETDEAGLVLERLDDFLSDLGCRRAAEKYDEIEYTRQRKDESAPKDLEEAAEAFAFTSLDEVVLYGCTLSGRRACFIAGAKWMKQNNILRFEHLQLKDCHDAWQKLKENKPEIANLPAVAFLYGAEWMAKQGMTVGGYIIDEMAYNGLAVMLDNDGPFKPNEQVIVQIRKK